MGMGGGMGGGGGLRMLPPLTHRASGTPICMVCPIEMGFIPIKKRSGGLLRGKATLGMWGGVRMRPPAP